LGSGAAGRAVFFAELYCATGDPSFRTSAVLAARSALAGAGPGVDDYGLYTGLSGIAVSLAEAGAAVDEGDLRRAAQRLFRRIALAAGRADGVRGWGDVYDVLGGWAGVGLSLLYAFEEFDDPTFLEAAVTAGDALLGVGDRVSEGGTRWIRGESMDQDLPNFSHGTAGVGYFMVRLGEVSGLPRFSEAALRAAEYLDRIADRRDGLYLVPYGVPNEGYATPYDIGWAHGPAGTSRLHYAIWMQTQDPDLRNRVEAGARAIVASGVPGESEDRARWSGPFRIDRRFGTSGAAAFLIDWGLATENRSQLEIAARVADDILERATNTANGIFWRLPLYGFQGPEEDGVFTGFFYGSAGLGLTLLQQHYAGIGLHPRIRLPDDPFPRGQVE
jgi:lantibiotic modifying enzyme